MAQPTKVAIKEFVYAAHGDLDKVRELLEANPQLLNLPNGKETALGAACQMRHKEIIQYLLFQGAEVDIYAACVLGNTELVKTFLDADPGLVNSRAPHAHGKPLLYFAVEQPEVEALLRSRGDDELPKKK